MRQTTMLLTAALGLAASANAGVVVINEVLGSTPGDDTEFIELRNRSHAPVDISGWQVELWDSDAGGSFGGADGASPYVIPAGTILAPRAHYLMANAVFATRYGFSGDQSIPNNGIENSSYTIILADSALNLMDAFFVTDGGAGDAANRAGTLLTGVPQVGPDGTFLPGGFYRSGPRAVTFLEFAEKPASATPGGPNLPAPGTLALLGLGGLIAARRRR